tara:strand:- start:137 stop:400 length:264 start_codon:yes stop_codon:yes gene_type:complete
MSWDKILKRSNDDEIKNIMKSYVALEKITDMIMNDLEVKFIPLLENGNFEQANAQWEKMRGGIMDLEGTMEGVKEANAFITRLLGDA